MPRPLRLWFPGAWYHITARGNHREPIFFSDADFQYYRRLLGRAVQHFGCRIHAYALMTNHVHLMVETAACPISLVMQQLQARYAIYLNQRQSRDGHVFQGRYHSRLVERDSYAMELSRYIHLNPVRAGLALDPLEYPWSSFRAYLHGHDPLVTTETLLGLIGAGADAPPAAYREFVLQGLSAREDALPRHWASPEYLQAVGIWRSGSDPLQKLKGV